MTFLCGDVELNPRPNQDNQASEIVRSHMSVIQQENAICPQCSRTFKRNGLQRHIRASHAIQILSQPTQLNHDTQQRSPLEEVFDTPFCNDDESLRSGFWKRLWSKA